MIVLAEFYARYRSSIPESELSRAAENLLSLSENLAHEYYADRYDQLAITLSVRVEIGSSRVWITIKGAGRALLLYATVHQVVDYLVTDARNLASLIVPRIPAVLNIPSQRPEYHARRLGVPGQLRRLFEKVEKRELSPEEATSQAIRLLQAQEENVLQAIPELKERLGSEFRSITPQPRLQAAFEAGDAVDRRNVPSRAPQAPEHREQMIARPPGSGFRRRRRGMIATRDPVSGNVRITQY
jgi:hypothetical protein